MFVSLIICGLCFVVGGVIFFFSTKKEHTGIRGEVLDSGRINRNIRIKSGALFSTGVLCIVLSLFTAKGQLVLNKFALEGKNSNWLVIDNSGGNTLRHWIIEGGYVESARHSDGWQFLDIESNLCYVSGDAFVMNITTPIETFKHDYKELYNIPTDQKALR